MKTKRSLEKRRAEKQNHIIGEFGRCQRAISREEKRTVLAVYGGKKIKLDSHYSIKKKKNPGGLKTKTNCSVT